MIGGAGCNKLQVLEWSEENGFAWTFKAELPAARYGAASVLHHGKIWLIGGRVDHTPSSSVLIYDIDADSWGTGPALPGTAAGAHAVALAGEIYVSYDMDTAATWVYRNAAWVDAVDRPRIPDAPGHVIQRITLG